MPGPSPRDKEKSSKRSTFYSIRLTVVLANRKCQYLGRSQTAEL